MIYFETERLIFRDFEEDDLPKFKRMNADPEVMRFFPKPLTDEETEKFYEMIKNEFATCGYGLYAVERKDSEEFIGFIGFHQATFEADFTPCIEIGWRLKKEAWGHGFATEGAKACLDYAKTAFDFDKIYSFTSKLNIPSERVMQKIGLTPIKTFMHPKLNSNHPLALHILYGCHL